MGNRRNNAMNDTVSNGKKQSVVAGHALVKIEDILKKCGLENVLVKFDGNEYIALDEVKKAIKSLHRLESS